MPSTPKDIKEIMYDAANADEAKSTIRRLKDFVNPGTTSGIKKNIYDFIQSGQDKFFKEIEKHFVKKAKEEGKNMYALPREMTTQEAQTGSANTQGKLRTAGQREADDKDRKTAKEDSSDEEMAIMVDTRQSVDELSDLMGQVNDLKQDEANLKTEIDRSPTDEKREELKRNLGVVIEKRRAAEETAQMTLNEVLKAPGKMQKFDPSKVEAIEEMVKEAQEMGGDRPPKAESKAESKADTKQSIEVNPTTAEAMPTMSPDEMDKVAEGLRKAKEEADRKAKEEEEERVRVRRELGEREARRREQPPTEPTKGKDGPKMTITRSKASTVPDDIQPLPMERISTRNKNLAQLLDDLKYFFNTYPDTLRREIEKYEQLDKMSMPLVERFHKMIVGKLYDPEKSKKRVGIILDAREYIAQQVNEILAKRATDGLKPEEIVSITDPEKKSDAKDFGNYEVKEGRQGGVQFLRREPLYRLMPETNDKNVYPMEAKAKKGRLRVGPPPTRYNSLVQNAKLEFKQNPFTEPKKDIVRLQF